MKSATEWKCKLIDAAPPVQDTALGGGYGLHTSRTASQVAVLLPHLGAAVSCAESTRNLNEEACTDEATAVCPKVLPVQSKSEAVILEAAAEPGPSGWRATTGRAAETAGSQIEGFRAAELPAAEVEPAEEDVW